MQSEIRGFDQNREQFGVRAMCWSLHIQPSGFYAWLKARLSQRALKDARQTEFISTAWQDSGKVYGYRKLHNDLREQGGKLLPKPCRPLGKNRRDPGPVGHLRRQAFFGG